MVMVARVPRPLKLAQTSVPWLPCWLSALSPQPPVVPNPSELSRPQQIPSKGAAFAFTPNWKDWSNITSPISAFPDSAISSLSITFFGDGKSKLSRRINDPVTSTSSTSSSLASSSSSSASAPSIGNPTKATEQTTMNENI